MNSGWSCKSCFHPEEIVHETQPKERRTLSIQGAYYRTIEALACRLGPGGLENLAGILASIRFAGNGRMNRVYLGHLERIFPELDRTGLRKVLKGYWRVHQRAFLGLFYSRRFSKSSLPGLVSLENREGLDSAVSGGKGVLLLVPHFGDERSLHILLAIMGYPMHVISSRYPGAPSILREARLSVSRRWHHVAFPDQPIGWLYEALARGEVVQISPTAYGGPKGHWVSSFDVPVLASSTPVRLARSTGCRMVVASNSILPGMRYRISFREFRPDSLDAAGTGRLFSLYQEMGKKSPEQYNWMNLVIRHRETNTIARLGYIPQEESVLEAGAAPSDWDPRLVQDPHTLSSISSGAESSLPE